MKSKLLITLLLTFGLLLSACGPRTGETPTSMVDTTETSEIPVTGATATEVMTEAPTLTEEVATETPVMSTEVTATDVTLKVSDKGDNSYVVDDQGRAMYIFVNDTQDGNSSACTDDCATNWPPVLVSGTPTAGDGVDSSLLGTITRDDGSEQVTYNGWPLYYSDLDSGAGDTNGQGAEGVWYLISPTGDQVQP